MSRGKRICAELKQIRRTIAKENGIPLDIPECTYQGECRGTCPRCESEVRYLERQLLQRIKMGRVATVAGVAVSLASLTACGGGEIPADPYVLPGEMPVQTDSIVLQNDAKSRLNPELPEEVMVGGLSIIELGDQDSSILSDTGLLVNGGNKSLEGEELFGLFDGVVDPKFPGGLEALYDYLQQHICYPEEAKKNHIEGNVYVNFVVEEDGSLTNPRILRDIGGGCGQETLRVVRSMPKWEPGKQGGKPVRVPFNLPVKFTLPTVSEPAQDSSFTK